MFIDGIHLPLTVLEITLSGVSVRNGIKTMLVILTLVFEVESLAR